MREDEEIRFVIEIEVHDVEGFAARAEECAGLSRTEPGTLVYDWYLDRETGRARLYEAYESLEALDIHVRGPVFSGPGVAMMETCEFIHVDAFGDFGERTGQPGFWPMTYWGPAFAGLAD